MPLSDALDSRVVLALDVPTVDAARALAARARDGIGMVKVGLELFVAAGSATLAVGAECNRPTFLDLKLHDIPETVERAVARASSLGARMLTVHAAGGPAMLERAVARADREGAGLQIVAVTVLTSLDERDLAAVGVPGAVATQVERLASMAWSAGVRAFVCSPREASTLRAALGPTATLVTPGVRPASPAPQQAAGDDQKRTMTASEAAAAGADWIVVGRPIRDAADPAAAALGMAREFANELARLRATRGHG